jgi:PhzF family phenazine biosynthesis protein
MKFWIVDAFTNKHFAGNPAGVIFVAEFPSLDFMQNIASELNLSETAFIKPISESLYHIRWFSPNSEAPLCGHATIASVHILLQEGLTACKTLIFQSLSGNLEITIEDQWINLNFPRYVPSHVELSPELRAIVNETPIYTGFAEHCFLMEFENAAIVKNLNPDLRLLTNLPCRALIVTAKTRDSEFLEYDFISRYFAPRVGINEDPACGSSYCRLIPYWSQKLCKKQMIAYQASKRGGVIKCLDLENRVQISGQAVTVAQGDYIL